MDPKAPKKLCALREMLRHKHCPCSEFSPLHSRLCCTAEDIWRLPFAALHRMRTMLRVCAVISSCVKRMRDKGWQDRLWRREDGKRLQEVHARAWWRRVQPFSEASRVFHFTCSFFYGSTGEVNFLMSCEWHQDWNMVQLASSEMGGQHNVILFFPACTFL